MFNLGVPGDVNNSIFMLNAYPWADSLGVMRTDDFSRRVNGGGAPVNPRMAMQPQQKQGATAGHGWLVLIAIVAVVIIVATR